MAKKPSEWTPQEAWAKCCETIGRACVAGGYGHIENGIVWPPFPADPPEVVLQIVLVHGSDGGALTQDEIRMVCSELLARREAERKP